MKSSNRIPIHLLCLLGAVYLSGCATPAPIPSKRLGLIDRLARSQGAHPISQKAKFESETSKASKKWASESGQYAESALDLKGLSLRWPLEKVVVSSQFGTRGSDFHEGVDLSVPSGTSVYAAEAGTVLYASNRISGYGSMVVIRHNSKIATVYAHNSRLLVKRGDRVKRGQKIAYSGQTGRSSGPHLHFEVRSGVAAMDPMRVLNSSSPAQSNVNHKIVAQNKKNELKRKISSKP